MKISKKSKKVFLKKLKELGYTQSEFAIKVGRGEDALKRWNDESIPEWAWLIIELMEKNAEYDKFIESHNYVKSFIDKYTI